MSAQAEWRRLDRFEKRELPITIFLREHLSLIRKQIENRVLYSF